MEGEETEGMEGKFAQGHLDVEWQGWEWSQSL